VKANNLSAAILAARSCVHFPDVFPWLDLYYWRRQSAMETLVEEEICTALDDLLVKAIMEFGLVEDIWTRECCGHLLLLFRSDIRNRVFSEILPSM
jgi:hypothetical protein